MLGNECLRQFPDERSVLIGEVFRFASVSVHVVKLRFGAVVLAEEFSLSVSHGEIRQILHSVEGISIGRAVKENRTLT